MAEQSRNYLKQRFDDGERPTGKDFTDFIESFINKEDDKVRLASGDNLNIPAGLTLSNAPVGAEGTIRFNAGQVELFSGGAWNPIAGESGAFTEVAGGPSVAFAAGNVGIGNFAVAPTHKLDITLGQNNGAPRRVRFGKLVVHNGTADDAAYISNESAAAVTDLSYALKQDSQANTTINAGQGARLILAHNNQTRFQILTSGNITISPVASVAIDGNVAIGALPALQNKNLLVFGNASKLVAGGFDAIASDVRVKKDVKSLHYGLREICRLNPVFYKFNGEGGTPEDGKEYVGLLAQELNEVMPFMVKKSEIASANDKQKRDLLTYESGPLTFIMINAIRELTEKVEKLEAELKEIKSSLK